VHYDLPDGFLVSNGYTHDAIGLVHRAEDPPFINIGRDDPLLDPYFLPLQATVTVTMCGSPGILSL
jgi:hypothetical protein